MYIFSPFQAAQERKKQAAQNEEGSTPNKSKPAAASKASEEETEAERKIKTLFLKETSKIVVKSLEEYRAAIKSKEDFKYLAKKVSFMTHFLQNSHSVTLIFLIFFQLYLFFGKKSHIFL